MARHIYTLLLHLLLPAIALRLVLRARKLPAYRERWPQRFGFNCPEATERPLWIHAVSVGEVQAAAPLIDHLLQHHPQLPLLITTMTPTGATRVKQRFGKRVTHVYCPYDLPWALGKFLARIRPRACVIIETELWPNLLAACQQRKIPVVLANARLSARSARGYARFKHLSADMLSRLYKVGVQNEEDGQRFLNLGLQAEQLVVTGSLKFDQVLDPAWLTDGQALRQQWGPQRPVWVAASTHDDEEAQLLRLHQQLLQRYPDLLLILVPRHPERFDAVAQLCETSTLTTVRRSQGALPAQQTQVYLGDTMGELMSLMAAADMVFVGGSLVERGGHNPLEPALLSKPIVTGTHTFNFDLITRELISAGALVQCADTLELGAQLQRWLDEPLLRECAGEAATHYLDRHRGAVERLYALIQPLLTDGSH